MVLKACELVELNRLHCLWLNILSTHVELYYVVSHFLIVEDSKNRKYNEKVL